MIQEKVQTRLMGSDFELIVIEHDHALAEARLRAGITEIQRIEALLTEFSDDSQTALINRHAGATPVSADEEVFHLIQRCQRLSAITQGAFDITAGALRALYDFKRRIAYIPDKATLTEALTRVGHQYILAENGKLLLTRPGMRIGFGAIGKGYAADKVRALWQAQGVRAGVINASGDLTAWGSRPDGQPWKVGIADPAEPSAIICWLPVHNASVATSGNYEQYFEIDGVRYSHNLDPRTGLPVREIKSATVISPSAEMSDALATAVTVMGVEAGLHLIDQIPHTHSLIIDNKDRIFTSKNLESHVYS